MRRDKLLQMFEMQQSLNDDTNGKGWESGYTKDEKIISWKRCIYMESVELIDSFAWKHWKDISREPDWANVKIELVDIWHFIMSLALETAFSKKQPLSETIDYLADSKNFDDFCKEAYSSREASVEYILNQIESIIHKSSGHNRNLLDDIVDEFFILSLNCGLNLNILFENYMAKNILNRFRQDNGYKEGKYIKIWNGKEDNVVLMQILKESENIDVIYTRLEEEYKKL